MSQNYLKFTIGGYESELSPKDIKHIIQYVMADRGIPAEGGFLLSPVYNSIENGLRYFRADGTAWFSCPLGHHRWWSCSWCELDLRKQEICHQSKKACTKCSAKVAPQFTQEAVVNMAHSACSELLERCGKIAQKPQRGEQGQIQRGGLYILLRVLPALLTNLHEQILVMHTFLHCK